MSLSSSLDNLAIKADDWSDFLLPSAINESKQMVKSKLFNSVLFLGSFCFIIIAVGLYIFPTKDNLGPTCFLFFNGIMDVGLILVIPMMLYQNMSAERSNGSFALMSITAITPIKIVMGKWQSGLMQSLVFGSIVVPGLIYCYFFNGIAISVIFLSVVLTIISAQLAILSAIFFCSIATLKANRLSSQFVSTTTNVFILIITLVLKGAMSFEDNFTLNIFSTSFIVGAIIFFILLITTESFLLALSAARLSAYAINKSTIPRVIYSLFVIEMAILLLINFRFIFIGTDFFYFPIIIFNSFVAFFFLMEKDTLTKKVFLKYNLNEGFVKNSFKVFFYPGKSSAYLLYISQTLLLSIAYGISARSDKINLEFFVFIINPVSYISSIYFVFFIIHNKFPNVKSNVLSISAIVVLLCMVFLSNFKALHIVFAISIVLVSIIVSIGAIMKQNRTQEITRDFAIEDRGGA